MARPKEIDVKDVIRKLDKYIKDNEEPLIQEFILNYGISKSRFYALAEENSLLKDTIKNAILKQEIFLIRGTERGKLNATFSIFRLKQKCFGWSDKQEVEHSGETTQNINIMSEEDKKRKYEDLKKRMSELDD